MPTSRRNFMKQMGMITGASTLGLDGKAKKAQKGKKLSPPVEPIPVQEETNTPVQGFQVNNENTELTTNQGLKMAEDQFSLKAGQRGPTLLEDFHLREKITHFDHERIPERIVHARGTGAHGEFELLADMSQYTKADFLNGSGKKTPVFVRFSTVAGGVGSTDTPRDVRGFAVKFYTQEGNYDLVGNNIPVFFIQDAIKFPDFVHAVKSEPHNQLPTAASAHDTFWDFVTQNQETAHMVMWAMSYRTLPRSLRMMDGFGVHTFRLINAKGQATFVKFHWRSTLGAHGLVWDENQKVSGKDSDSQRRDLIEAIDAGSFPEYELFFQLLPEADEFKFDFDVLDPTKLWPEELVPLVKVGRMVLNRNVDNFFAEVDQAAFHPGHLVPGIDFTNDPLLQGRLFSYTDTQILRLGGPNFAQIPVNQPVVPVHNNQRDGYHMHMIHKGPVSYQKSSIEGQSPTTPPFEQGGFAHYQEKVEGRTVKQRADRFADHFSQAIMFYNSQSEVEKKHITDAMSFELTKVERPFIRQNAVDMFANVNQQMAETVADRIGANKPNAKAGRSPETGPNGQSEKFVSPALSMMNTKFKPDTRKVAVLIDDPATSNVARIVADLKAQQVVPEVIASKLGKTQDGVDVKHTHKSADPVLFDALLILNPEKPSTNFVNTAAVYFKEQFEHYKPIEVVGNAKDYLKSNQRQADGVLVGSLDLATFVKNIAQHRFWGRKTDLNL